jgi:trehalose-6-phosphate synthase
LFQALLVNPYEVGNVAAVLHRALQMPSDERELRMNALRKRERANDVDVWMKSFLKAIGNLIEEDGKEEGQAVTLGKQYLTCTGHLTRGTWRLERLYVI